MQIVAPMPIWIISQTLQSCEDDLLLTERKIDNLKFKDSLEIRYLFLTRACFRLHIALDF